MSNLQHPALDEVVLLKEPDAPPTPGPAHVKVRERIEARRLTYALWMEMVKEEDDTIGILINSDIALGKGWDKVEEILNTPDSVIALVQSRCLGC